MIFITYSDLNNDVLRNISRIPHDVDLIVGIPRSGLMLASIISLYLNKPYADLESFLRGSYFEVGKTKNVSQNIRSIEDAKKILIVEDTVCSGNSLLQAKNKVNTIKSGYEIMYLAAYISSETKKLVDIYFRIIDEERVFEWNYMHNILLQYACLDIDGVLCRDPIEEENDDGDNYISFLKRAEPKLIPTRNVGHIVTSRLEKYRRETEEWLKNNNINYKSLHMMNLGSAKERQEKGNHAQFKAEIYQKLRDSYWFIESNDSQAQEIARRTKKAVFCVDNSTYYSEGGLYKTKNNLRYGVVRPIKRRIKVIWKNILRNKDSSFEPYSSLQNNNAEASSITENEN